MPDNYWLYWAALVTINVLTLVAALRLVRSAQRSNASAGQKLRAALEVLSPGVDVLLQLRIQGNSRRDRWHTPETEPWTGADWSNAMCGEAGEAANVVKKLRRIETGTGSANGLDELDLRAMLADELADTIAYADLLAQHYDIDLRQAIADKFNVVSQREGFPERIAVDS